MRFALALALCAALLGGCSRSDGSGGGGAAKSAAPSAAAQKRAFAGSPAPLAALHAQGNRLLDGGADAFKARLARLRGHPVVVNKWASWCGPCRAEFPVLQRQSVQLGRRVAFVGVNSDELHKADGASFLKRFPLSYPSYSDKDQKVAAVFNAVQGMPITAFYDARGKLAYVHSGPYLSPSKLASDIRRYTGAKDSASLPNPSPS
jgi:cytochrome c biogenesis protein CcmG, thiol:disulfide interchange protein DsbE